MTRWNMRGNASARRRVKKAGPQKRFAGGKLRQCGFCGARVDRCSCEWEKAPWGKLSKKQCGLFCKFLKEDNRRRYYGDCLDVTLVCNWCTNFLVEGGSVACVVMAIFMFRFFNRVSTWTCIQEAFQVGSKAPNFDELEEALRNHDEKLHKPFAIPVTVWDEKGKYVGGDLIENAVWTFRSMWKHVAFRKIAALLKGGVQDTCAFGRLKTAWAELRTCYSGACGTLRFKNNLDIWVHAGMVWKEAINWWPVAKGSGPHVALKTLYGHVVRSEEAASECLQHLYIVLRKEGHFKTRSDSIGTVGLNLCGWQRGKKKVKYGKGNVTGLDRAIMQEEKEMLLLWSRCDAELV